MKLMMCKLCGEKHLEIRKRMEKSEIKKIEIEYETEFAYCPELEEEILIDDMLDKNLNNMRNAYRKKVTLLTSTEIISLRKKIGVSQRHLGLILGMGEASIGRIEKKVIQDRTTDDGIRRLIDDPIYLLERLEIVRGKIGEKSYYKILDKLDEKNDIATYEEKILKLKYSKYKEKSKLNGFTELDIKKAENMIIYFVNNCKKVFKTKLNKLLWYSDFKNFKLNDKGISGLVYNHLPYGAVPEGIDEILKLSKGIEVIEKINEDYGSVYYEIKPLKSFNKKLFTSKELKNLKEVSEKFKVIGNKEISIYMHEEEAYKHTKSNQNINYEFGKQLREF